MRSENKKTMDYFLHNDGDDSASGIAPAKAWRTLNRANQQRYRAGDHLYLRGGDRLEGNLVFNTANAATDARSPITIASYGAGQATIYAAKGDAILIQDCGGFVIKEVAVVGPGSDKKKESGCGVHFYNTLPGAVKLPFVRIEKVTASMFGRSGIELGASPPDKSKSGYRDVQITQCVASENVFHGIHIYGAWDEKATKYAHEAVVIAHCVAHGNTGDPEYRDNHSGNGIILSDTDGGRIEYCTAYNNGALCNAPQGGPIGIWAHAANRIIIQFCASYNNHTGRSTDGGGFDFDGGISNSILQYNYSGGNDGAGYLLYTYAGSPYTFRGNIVRYNISDNDGRKNRFGMIHVASDGPEVRDIDIYHNTIVTSPTPTGTPFALLVKEAAHVRVLNNLFVTEGGLPLLELAGNLPDLQIQGNAYWSGDAPFTIRDSGNTYRSLADWRTAVKQERLKGQDNGLQADPRLTAYHVKPPPSSESLAHLTAFQPRPDSPLRNAALDLKAAFGIDLSPQDFSKGKGWSGKSSDIGAREAK